MRVRRIPLVLLILVALAARGSHAYAQTTTGAVGVYYVGPEDTIADAIDLAAPYLVRVDQPDLAQVIVINNAPLKDSLRVFSNEIQQGRVGLVLFCGSLFPQNTDDLRALLSVSTFGLGQAADSQSLQSGTVDDSLHTAITWRSAPEIRARTLITNPNLLQPVVVTSAGQDVIQRVRGREQTQTLIVDAWFSHPANSAWHDWAYFDYLIYRLIADASGTGKILSFVDYPHSPTPDRAGRWALAGAGFSLMVGIAAIYYAARRRLYLNPDLADSWQQLTASATRPSAAQEWRQVGFHRPLAGFLTYLPLSLLLFLPLVAYRFYILPDLVLLDAQGLATWESVSDWTMVLWLLLDAGTGTAVVRLFSAHHIRFPQRASRYIQFYVWWQLLSGVLQLGVICILVATALPASGLSHLAYYVLARAVLQVPGFLKVFSIAFRARQRFDYQQFLNLFTMLGVPLLQVALVLLFQVWSETTPDIWQGLAGSLGLAAGIFLGEVLTFLLGARLHHREGQALGALFLPTFDSQIASEVLKFGIPWALGAAIPALSFVLQTRTLSASLTPPELRFESWHLILLVIAGFEILLVGLYNNIMPMLAEAASLNYRTLLRYITSQGIRYGAWFSFFLFAVLSAIGERALASVLAPRFEDAAPWVMAMLVWGALQWLSWLPDRMLEAAGRPWLIALPSLLEHIARIGGGVVLVRMWGVRGLLVAYGAGLLLRTVLVRMFANRHLVRTRIYGWQTLIAPAASAMIIYQLLRVIEIGWEQPTWVTSMLFSIGILFPSLLVYAFVTALLGGWDDGGLAELRQAVTMCSIGLPFAWLLLQCVRIGARLSPLHGRYPIALYEWAQEEAGALTLAQAQPK